MKKKIDKEKHWYVEVRERIKKVFNEEEQKIIERYEFLCAVETAQLVIVAGKLID